MVLCNLIAGIGNTGLPMNVNSSVLPVAKKMSQLNIAFY